MKRQPPQEALDAAKNLKLELEGYEIDFEYAGENIRRFETLHWWKVWVSKAGRKLVEFPREVPEQETCSFR